MLYILHPRQAVIENVDRMINCGDPSFGGAMYICPHCDNPHIHCLISEGDFSDDGSWRTVRHFNYNLLRKSFQTALLNQPESHLGPSF